MPVGSIIATLRTLAQSIGSAPAVQAEYIKLQLEVTEILAENNRLADEVKALRDRLAVRDALRFDDNRYFRRLADGKEDGPYCAPCWDTKSVLIHLFTYFPADVGRLVECPVCRTSTIDEPAPKKSRFVRDG